MNENQKKGIIKLLSGLVLVSLGVLGFIFGKNAQTVTTRSLIYLFSILAIFTGFYLFVDGLQNIAKGQYGITKYNSAPEFIFNSPEQFKSFLNEHSNELNLTDDPKKEKVRRIEFRCQDNSNHFRVFLTKFGIFNVPKKNVICTNGQKLLTYNPAYLPEEGWHSSKEAL